MAYHNRTDLFHLAKLAQKKLLNKQTKQSKTKKHTNKTRKLSLDFDENCSPTQMAGKHAEDTALKYLIAQGLVLLERNLLYKTGEIDLVMCDAKTLVFIEVRLRNNSLYGDGLGSINKSKQLKIIHTSKFYLNYIVKKHFKHNIPPCRFDVVSLSNNEIKWIKSAFVTASI